jgi:hypothetical protein
LAWLIWNQLIFGDALFFQFGPYAKPSLWVSSHELAVGHWWVAVKDYYYAVTDNLSFLGACVAGAGLVILIVRQRLQLRSLPVLSMLVFLPFFVAAVEEGQRPLHVSQIGDQALYNVRFGLVMILPASIFVGYLVGELERYRWSQAVAAAAAIAVIALIAAPLFDSGSIATLKEALVFQRAPLSQEGDAAAAYLEKNYSGGRILMDSFGNDAMLLRSHISLSNYVYEGSYRLWGPALADPERLGIHWIVMRHAIPTDGVYRALHGQQTMRDYHLVYGNAGYSIYRDEGVGT